MLQVLLVLHILAAVVFVGNIITAAFWKAQADRSENLETIAITARSLLKADYIFTAPGIVVLLVTGIWMVGLSVGSWARFQEPWLGGSFVLLIITAIIWLAVLLPQLRRMVRLAQEGADAGALGPEYRKASRIWSMFGGIATLLPVLILFLMVLKP
ncbi:MAG: DUF2269 domain-containing protein [Chloroflexi bacterium]|nr:DUF2269 domain-containing protein [Chloroflexota bacterium]